MAARSLRCRGFRLAEQRGGMQGAGVGAVAGQAVGTDAEDAGGDGRHGEEDQKGPNRAALAAADLPGRGGEIVRIFHEADGGDPGQGQGLC